MSKINAGVVVVTQFVSSDSSTFGSYLDYMNRSNAVRNDNIGKYTIPTLDNEIKQYNEYMDYMADSRKTTELFTDNKDRLTADEKETLKGIFETAQENDSLMWQTVISFDNKWLADNGLYNSETGILDEVKLKEYTRLTMNTLLDKEGMKNNSVWSASVHYNTDNIHIHIATVQPIPQRELKTTKTIRFNADWIENNLDTALLNSLEKDKQVKAHGKRNKDYCQLLNSINKKITDELGIKCKLGDYIQLNSNGTVDISYYGENEDIPYMAELESEVTTQKGKFKESSITAAKSKIVQNILSQNLINTKINDLMRNTIIGDFKETDILNSTNLKLLYYNIYKNLPTNKRLWQYNNNVINPLRTQIDKFTSAWLNEYHKEDFETLTKYLEEQQAMYQTAYGGKGNDYAENNIKYLYSRCGNIILKNLKELAKSDFIDFDELPIVESEIEDNIDFDFLSDEVIEENNETALPDEELAEYLSDFSEDLNIEFSEKYKKAKRLFYGTKNLAPDKKTAFNMFEEEAQNGNIFAIHDLANCYAKGFGCVANEILAAQLYKKALLGLEEKFSELKSKDKKSLNKTDSFNIDYLPYRIGKMYYYGLGTELDTEASKQKAFDYFNASSDYAYSAFYLAKFYENGEPNVVEKNSKKAFNYYSTVCENTDMPYAYYKKGFMLEKGIGTEANKKASDENYTNALNGFKSSLESHPDDFLQYRVGTMYLKGKGCDIDLDKAIKYLKMSTDNGNDMAACTLAMTYIKTNSNPEQFKKAMRLLHRSADKSKNALAEYNLGIVYLQQDEIEKGLKYLTRAAKQGNQFAQYKLGIYYLKNDKIEKAIHYLTVAAEQGNQFAQYKLGVYYLNIKETEKGIKYLTAAAKQNNSFAQYKLGTYYLDKKEIEKSITYLTSASEQNNPFAQYTLAKIYDKGIVVRIDKDKATELYAKAYTEFLNISQSDNFDSNSSILYNLGIMNYEGLGIEKNILKGVEYLISSAEQKNQYAQYKLGVHYLKNNEISKALEYLTASYEQGNESAQYKLGTYYLDNKEEQKGVDLLTDIADNGNVYAQYKLGSFYFKNAEMEKAVHYLTAAAEQNNEYAQLKLGSYYLKTGKTELGIQYLLDSAEQDNIFAHYQLGVFYAKDEQFYDFKKSEEHLLKAVGHDFDFAEYHLGVLYLSDKENLQHILKGIDYLKIAANNNNQFAQYQLGKLYYYGNKFIKPDSDLANDYLRAAAEQGNQAADYLLNRKANNLRKAKMKLPLRKMYIPYECGQSFQKLLSQLGRDYRTHDNIKNQIAYAKLQQKIENER